MSDKLKELSINRIQMTGTITYIDKAFREGNGIIHGLNVAVRRKGYKGELIDDDLRVMICHNKQVSEQLQVGERIRFVGELQRRNHDKFPEKASSTVTNAIANYMELFEEFPIIPTVTANANINQRMREDRVDFKRVVDVGLLEKAPTDSRYSDSGERLEGPDYLTYKISQAGEVSKKREATIYEVLVEEAVEIIEPLKEFEVDENKALLRGQIRKINQPFKRWNNTHSITMIVYVSSHIYDEPRTWGISVSIMDDHKLSQLKKLKVNDYIYVSGIMHSKKQQQLQRLVNHTKGGTRKLKEKMDEYYIREVYAKNILKVIKAEDAQ